MIKRSLVKGKRVVTGMLGATICLSLLGCGGKKTDFSEYGNISEDEFVSEEVQEKKSEVVSTTEDSPKADSKESEEGIPDYSWDETGLMIQGVNTKADLKIFYTDINNPKKFIGHKLKNVKDDEDEIVKSFFGDTAQKIEELSYKDSSSYITFLYKYRMLKHQFEAALAGEEDKSFYDDGLIVHEAGYIINLESDIYSEEEAINSSFCDVFKWDDNDDYSIHMYEGKYNNINYGLLLAYDYKNNERYVFFDPISIEEYFPGAGYQTVNLTSGIDPYGLTIPVENTCEYSTEDAKNMANDILVNNLKMDMTGIRLTDDYMTVMGKIGTMGGSFVYNPEESADHLCELIFSKADVVDTAVSYGTVVKTAGYLRLTAQDYKIPEGNYFSYYVEEYSKDIPDVEQVADGYAVFVTSEYDSLGSGVQYDCSGVVKVTSKGIYGIDLCQNIVIDEIDDEIKLLDPEEMKQCIISELDQHLDLDKMSVNLQKVVAPKSFVIQNGFITFMDLKEESEEDKCTIVPCLSIQISTVDSGANAVFDAITGKLLSIQYTNIKQ